MLVRGVYRVVLFCLTLLYPIGIIFHSSFLDKIVLILGIFWGLNVIIAKDKQTKVLSSFISLFFLLSICFSSSMLSYFYPVMINAFLLFMFATSLKSQPIITKFAMLKEPNLSDFGKKYTRNLTKVWCLFFIINGLIAFILIFFEDKSYWAYYNGFLSYILIGVFFVVEFVIRKIVKKRYDV